MMTGFDGARSVKEAFTVHPRAAAPGYRNEGERLEDVYGTCSGEKRRAYEYCRELCEEFHGEGFRIAGHNTFAFTVQFEFDDPESGRRMRAMITRDYNHAYYIG